MHGNTWPPPGWALMRRRERMVPSTSSKAGSLGFCARGTGTWQWRGAGGRSCFAHSVLDSSCCFALETFHACLVLSEINRNLGLQENLWEWELTQFECPCCSLPHMHLNLNHSVFYAHLLGGVGLGIAPFPWYCCVGWPLGCIKNIMSVSPGCSFGWASGCIIGWGGWCSVSLRGADGWLLDVLYSLVFVRLCWGTQKCKIHISWWYHEMLLVEKFSQK